MPLHEVLEYWQQIIINPECRTKFSRVKHGIFLTRVAYRYVGYQCLRNILPSSSG